MNGANANNATSGDFPFLFAMRSRKKYRTVEISINGINETITEGGSGG